MKHLKKLHENEYGTAIYCKRHQHIHLTFGNIALAQSHGEFFNFFDEINILFQENKNGCPYRKNLALRTPISKIALIFSLVELEQLIEILENSRIVLEIEEILRKEGND